MYKDSCGSLSGEEMQVLPSHGKTTSFVGTIAGRVQKADREDEAQNLNVAQSAPRSHEGIRTHHKVERAECS